MISDYFFYLACVIGFLLIVRVIYVFEKSYEQFKKELPRNRGKLFEKARLH